MRAELFAHGRGIVSPAPAAPGHGYWMDGRRRFGVHRPARACWLASPGPLGQFCGQKLKSRKTVRRFLSSKSGHHTKTRDYKARYRPRGWVDALCRSIHVFQRAPASAVKSAIAGPGSSGCRISTPWCGMPRVPRVTGGARLIKSFLYKSASTAVLTISPPNCSAACNAQRAVFCAEAGLTTASNGCFLLC